MASTNVHIMQPWECQQSTQQLWSYHQQQQTENDCLPLAYYQNRPTPNSQFNRPTNQRMLLMSALNAFLFVYVLIVCFLGENQPNFTLVVSVGKKNLTCEWIVDKHLDKFIAVCHPNHVPNGRWRDWLNEGRIRPSSSCLTPCSSLF